MIPGEIPQINTNLRIQRSKPRAVVIQPVLQDNRRNRHHRIVRRMLNNRVVFQSREPYGKALLRYYLLAVPQLAASTLLLSLFVWLFRVQSDNVSTLVKILVDGGLFVASYFIQKFWVFSQRENETDSTAEDKTAEK